MSDSSTTQPSSNGRKQSPESDETQATDDAIIGTFSVGNRTFGGDTVIKLLGVSWLIGFSWLFNGLFGIAIAVMIGVITHISRPVIVVGLAHAGLLVLYPEISTLQAAVEVVVFEIGLLAILFSDPPVEGLTVLLTVSLSVAFGTTLFVIAGQSGYWAAVAILLFIIFLVAFVIHRYERVSLGLVETETDLVETES